MSIYHGKDARLYIAGYDISSIVASVTPVQEREMVPYAVQGNVGYSQMLGLAKDALSIDGLFDDNYHTILDTLFASASGYQVVIPYGTTLSNRAMGCDAVRLNKYVWRAVVTDINRLVAELMADDLPWDECILVFPKATKTSDGNHTVIDNAAVSILSSVGYLQIFVCGGDDALIVKIQDSIDNFAADTHDLITFTTANALGAERKAVTAKSGTADATEASKLHDADGGFEASDVGKTIYNSTDVTYTTVSAFVDSGELTLTDDIMASGEAYTVGAVRRYLRVNWAGTPTYSATFAVVFKRG
jgi:hypothetical protein